MSSGSVSVEKDIEDWIESVPELLQSGLTIVGRQVRLDAGIADLIGLDTQGRWVVIEIKRGQIRRDTIAQAVDYASSMTELPMEKLRQIAEEYLQTRDSSLSEVVGQAATSEVLELANREVSIAVVGTGEEDGLERMVRFLSEKGQLAITLISFSVFEQPSGEIVLARTLSETDMVASEKPLPHKVSVERIIEVAEAQGVGRHFRILHRAATELGLYARPYKHSKRM
jgi:Holliday junction resolvase-like predicted endonuclease